MILYLLDLECPRCGAISNTVVDKTAPVINCGECLLDGVEVVELKVTKVTVVDGGPDDVCHR